MRIKLKAHWGTFIHSQRGESFVISENFPGKWGKIQIQSTFAVNVLLVAWGNSPTSFYYCEMKRTYCS
jgi:hypothetical protein